MAFGGVMGAWKSGRKFIYLLHAFTHPPIILYIHPSFLKDSLIEFYVSGTILNGGNTTGEWDGEGPNAIERPV